MVSLSTSRGRPRSIPPSLSRNFTGVKKSELRLYLLNPRVPCPTFSKFIKFRIRLCVPRVHFFSFLDSLWTPFECHHAQNITNTESDILKKQGRFLMANNSEPNNRLSYCWSFLPLEMSPWLTLLPLCFSNTYVLLSPLRLWHVAWCLLIICASQIILCHFSFTISLTKESYFFLNLTSIDPIELFSEKMLWAINHVG